MRVGISFYHQTIVSISEAKSTQAMNMALTYMFAHGYWIPSQEALHLFKLLMVFLQGFTKCAQLTNEMGLHRFGLMPKIHYLHHAAHRLRQESERSPWAVSPLGESVQMQEDYIGRPSRISRRVDVRQLHLRVVQRSLIAAQQGLESSDVDTRGLGPE